MQVLVDGDILVYRAGFATEYPKYAVTFGADFVKEFQYKKEALEYMIELEEEGTTDAELVVETILEPVQNALHIIDSMLGGIAYKFGVPTSELDVALTGANNFRIEVAKTQPYKGNRKKPKPTWYPDIRKYLVDKHNATVVDDEEADDYLGYKHYASWWFNPESSVIVTIDKDLDMIPGIHYNPVKEEQYYIEPEDADMFFLNQLITGDPGDHIPGIPGMAAAKAAKFIENVPRDDLLGEIHRLYCDHFGSKGDEIFEEQASLLWIRRGEGQHWSEYWREAGDTWQQSI